MKKLLLIFTLLFSTVMFSSPSYSEWTKLSKNQKSDFYVDFERIRKQGGYVFFWLLSNYYRPDHEGDLSDKAYLE